MPNTSEDRFDALAGDEPPGEELDRDLASQDVLIDRARELETQQWMLRVQLGERG